MAQKYPTYLQFGHIMSKPPTHPTGKVLETSLSWSELDTAQTQPVKIFLVFVTSVKGFSNILTFLSFERKKLKMPILGIFQQNEF